MPNPFLHHIEKHINIAVSGWTQLKQPHWLQILSLTLTLTILTAEMINDDITATQQSVLDAFPLTVVQPAAQPHNGNAFLQLSIPTFTVANDEGVRSNIETDRDLLPDWEFQEVRDFYS